MTRKERDELGALNKRVTELEVIALEIRTGVRMFIWLAKVGVAIGGLAAFFKGATSWESVADGFRDLVR